MVFQLLLKSFASSSACDPNAESKKYNFSAVRNNLNHFSEAIKKWTSKAHKACMSTGTPNLDVFKAAMRMNLINNNTVVTEDTHLAKNAMSHIWVVQRVTLQEVNMCLLQVRQSRCLTKS